MLIDDLGEFFFFENGPNFGMWASFCLRNIALKFFLLGCFFFLRIKICKKTWLSQPYLRGKLGKQADCLQLDFLKSPLSCIFSTYWMKDFSYLIAANFSDPKTGRCASTNQRSPGYPMGTELLNYGQRNVTCS